MRYRVDASRWHQIMQQHRERIPTILVVEDDAAVRNSMKFSLEAEGYQVRDYSEARDVLEAPDLSEIDCLVVDYRLEGMNGLELVRQMRARGIRAPVIMITTLPSLDLRRDASAAGIHIIVEKPLLGNTLADQIQSVVGSTG
jgi:two-component system, LuxR family, response regulator FixJ